jgi:hypothetical protein
MSIISEHTTQQPVARSQAVAQHTLSPEPVGEACTGPAAEPHRPDPDRQVRLQTVGPLFTQRPLILGENEQLYDELFARVTHAVRPRDIIEEIWVKDVVDEVWEAQRYRRLRAALLRAAAKPALVRQLKAATDPQTAQPLTLQGAELFAISCLQGDEQSRDEVAEMLTDVALDFDAIMALALADRIPLIETVDRLITSADRRRDKALSSIDRRREAFAQRLRRVAEDLASEPITTPVSDTEAA